MRVCVGTLLCITLLLSLAQLPRAQNCSSPQIDLFTARLNVSRNSVIMRSINAVQLSFGITDPLPPSQQGIFAALTTAYGLNPTEESFYNFAKATNDISDSYFRACWGLVGKRTNQWNTTLCFNSTCKRNCSINRNQSSDAPQIRENLGISSSDSHQCCNVQKVRCSFPRTHNYIGHIRK